MHRFIVFAAILPAVADASEPTVAMDYSAPESFLAVPSTLGDREKIAEMAMALKGGNDRATVRKVLEWMETNLKYDANKAYEWRNFDDVVQQGCYGGCADQAIVCGVLLKAAGIPALWVKTMDVPSAAGVIGLFAVNRSQRKFPAT